MIPSPRRRIEAYRTPEPTETPSGIRGMALISCVILIFFATVTESGAQTESGHGHLIGDIGRSGIAEADGAIAGMVRRYISDYGSLDRFHSAPYSPYRTGRFTQLFGEWLEALDRVTFDSLTTAERVDHVLFRNHLLHELRQLRTGDERFLEMQPLIPFAPALIELEDDRRKLRTVDPKATAKMLNNIVEEIRGNRKLLDSLYRGSEGPGEDGRLPGGGRVKKTVANRAFRAVGEIRSMLGRWYRYFDGYDPGFTWWVGEPFRELDSVLGTYGDFLRDRIVGVRPDDTETIIGDPIGRAALIAELEYEMIPYTPEELISLAKKEMAWCEKEMLRATAELGFGDDWKKALEHVKMLHVEPGDQPGLIAELAGEAVDFLEARDLLTIPTLAKETWRMEMMSPERQKIAPFFLGGEVIQVSYPTNTMSHEEKMMSMRGNNRHFARATVHHELIPGHHLQGFMNSRHRTYRRVFGTPFWSEGWALYWELLLWEMDFQESPEDRVGMLFWRMHRCARIIFSLSFHLDKMTPEQCVEYLVDRVGHERENALAEVRRSFSGNYGPLYQAAYLLGGLQFRSLHGELVDSGKMSDREFHDTILRNNRMPVEMVRAILTDRPPARNQATQWRFYGDPGE